MVHIMNQLLSSTSKFRKKPTSQRFVEAGAVPNVSGKHKAFAAIGLKRSVCVLEGCLGVNPENDEVLPCRGEMLSHTSTFIAKHPTKLEPN